MVFLISAYLMPIIIMIISFSFRIKRRNKMTINFVSPFPCIVSFFNSMTVMICINMLFSPGTWILISLACIYFINALYTLFKTAYICEGVFVYGFRKIEASSILCEISNNRVDLYVNKTDLIKLRQWCTKYLQNASDN